MFWTLAAAGLGFMANENKARQERKVNDANYQLDTARQNLSNQANLSAAEKAYGRDLKVANAQLYELTATNDAIVEANRKNTLASHYKAGLLQMQVAMTKKQQVAQRVALREAGGSALGSVTANAAASGTIGASVDQVEKDIERTLGQALVQEDERWDVQAQNFQTQMYDITMSLENMLQSGVSAHNMLMPEKQTVILQDSVTKPMVPSTSDNLLGAIGQGLMGYAGQMAGLGLGNPMRGVNTSNVNLSGSVTQPFSGTSPFFKI